MSLKVKPFRDVSYAEVAAFVGVEPESITTRGIHAWLTFPEGASVDLEALRAHLEDDPTPSTLVVADDDGRPMQLRIMGAGRGNVYVTPVDGADDQAVAITDLDLESERVTFHCPCVELHAAGLPAPTDSADPVEVPGG